MGVDQTSGKWCTSNGSAVHCTADPPAGDNLGAGGTTAGTLYSQNASGYGYLGLNGTNYARFSDSALYLYMGGAWAYHFSPTYFRPYVNNATDLGTSSYKFRNAYFSADVFADGNFAANAADAVGAPGYSWNGDTNTGMWRPGADIVGMTAGGQESIRFYPTYIHAMSNQIKNLAAPTAANDAATKAYVDANGGGQISGVTNYTSEGGGSVTSAYHSFCVLRHSHDSSNIQLSVAAGPDSSGRRRFTCNVSWGPSSCGLMCFDL